MGDAFTRWLASASGKRHTAQETAESLSRAQRRSAHMRKGVQPHTVTQAVDVHGRLAGRTPPSY